VHEKIVNLPDLTDDLNCSVVQFIILVLNFYPFIIIVCSLEIRYLMIVISVSENLRPVHDIVVNLPENYSSTEFIVLSTFGIALSLLQYLLF